MRSGPYSASIAPAAGGRVLSLAWSTGGVRCPLLVEWDGAGFDEHDWPKAGAFPMLPFANRLPREGFRFEGGVCRPRPGPAGFALHGIAHRRAWSVGDASRERAKLRLVHDEGDEGWPWGWTAEQDIELGERGLRVTLALRNDAARPMPVGIGWHPYHPVQPHIEPAGLQFIAAARCELDSEGRAGAEQEPPPLFGMRRGETAVFTGWDRRLQISSTGGGTIAVGCDGASNLVLHRPGGGDYLCAEPVTELPGPLGQGTGAGGVLHPGEVRTLSWSCGYKARDLQD